MCDFRPSPVNVTDPSDGEVTVTRDADSVELQVTSAALAKPVVYAFELSDRIGNFCEQLAADMGLPSGSVEVQTSSGATMSSNMSHSFAWKPGRVLAMGERTVCLAAADDWLNEHESDESAHKTRRWLNQPPTDRQLAFLPPEYRQDFGLTRYQASALLAFRFNRDAIRSLVFSAADAAPEAAIGRAA